MGAKTKKSIKAVKKTFEIIQTLEELDGGGVSEVAEEVDLHPSTVHAHLQSLLEYGFVIKSGNIYRPSLKFLEIAGQTRHNKSIYQEGWREVESMAHDTGEMGNIGVEENGEIAVIYMSEGGQAVEKQTPIGKRNPLHCTGLGKAILADLPVERVESIIDERGLQARTEHTICDRDALFEELETIRKQGYALDNEELHMGIQCLATSVNVNGQPVGAISVTGPKNRFEDETYREKLLQRLLETENLIEVNLQFHL